jgi:hypothetical protein
LAKKPAGNPENPWAIAAHDLGKRRVITTTRKLRQFQVRALFMTVRQETLLIEVSFWKADPRGRVRVRIEAY